VADVTARALRQAAADRLMTLDRRGVLTSDHVRLSAFLTDAAATLSAAHFARVDAVYARATAMVCGWIADRIGRSCDHNHGLRGGGAWLGDEDAELAERMLEALHDRRAPLRMLYERRSADAIAGWHEVLGLYRLLGTVVADSPGRNTTITRLRGVQAGLDLHGIDLQLPPNLAYSVGAGLTTTPVTHSVVDRIRARTANPAHAAAVAIQLFTGAAVEELKFIPCVAFTGDALIFNSTFGYSHPADLCGGNPASCRKRCRKPRRAVCRP
jgi:hypothetical protein